MTFPRTAAARLVPLLMLGILVAAFPRARAAAQQGPSQPASPNGKIVFQSDQGGDPGVNEIYTMDADGRHQTRLTDNTADDAAPIWSPAGNQIAFVTNRGGAGYDIYLMNGDGTNQRPLRSAPNGGPLVGDNIEWSPDGTRIKYNVGGKIYVVEAVAPGGGDSVVPPQNVSALAPAGSFDSAASWSPDGTKLAVVSSACQNCPPDLYTVNADGTGRTQLTSTAGFEANPRWSPAGGRIAYEAFRNGSRDIYAANADGTGEQLLTAGVGSFGDLAWSHDGTRLAFRAANTGVYAVRADGTGLALLSDVQSSSGDIFWSPDGARVVFHTGNDNGFVDIFVVKADGSSRRANNYTKTRRSDEFASNWQRVATP